MFGLTILGNNSAVPAFNRHPTAQALSFDDQVFLIDCGEGTQSQLSKYKIKRSKINHIFISHLHGDHYFGLIGLITSFGLMGREHPLYIHGPALLQSIMELQLKAADAQLKFPLVFIPNQYPGVILSHPKMEVSCFPVKHRIECWGYLFREIKQPRKILREKTLELRIPFQSFHQLQMGDDYITPDGQIISNREVTVANSPGRTYAYSADTIYDESLCDLVHGVSLLYHESTYLHELADRAQTRYHSTARQAAIIAKKAKVNKLLIGHFSSKYDDLRPFLEEAKLEFENVELAIEGITFRILDTSQAFNEKPSPSPSRVHSGVPMEA